MKIIFIHISPKCVPNGAINNDRPLLVQIGSDNGLWPVKHQVIIWTSDGLKFTDAYNLCLNELPVITCTKDTLWILSSNWWEFIMYAAFPMFSTINSEEVVLGWKNTGFQKYLHPTRRELMQCLTHWCWDKIAAISHKTYSNAFSWLKIYKLSLNFHWSLFPNGPINNIPALVQIMAWRWPGA